MFYISRKIERSRFMQPGKFLLFPAICSCCFLLRARAMPIETGYRQDYPPLNHYLYPQAFSTVATTFRFVAGPAFSDSVQTALEEKRKAAIRQQHWTEAAKLSNSLSVYYYSNLRYDEAIRYSTEGVDFARKANHPTLEATNLYGLGVVYFEKFDYPLAVEYCLKALRLAPRITDAELLIAINNRLGMVYKRIGDYDKAKAYLLPAYQDALRLKKGPLKDLLMNLGNTEEYLGNYKQSLAYYQRYLALTPADAFTQVLAYNNMGAIYMKLNEPQKAEALFHKAYAVEDTVKNIQGRAYSFYDFAWAAQAQNRCDEAIGYALKSLEEAKRYGVKSLEWLNYHLLSDCYNKTGNFQLANEYVGKYHATKDSIYASQRLSKIGVLEATYKFELESGKKQQEILSLQKENALRRLEVSNLLNKEKITQLQLANLANEKQLAQLQVSNLQQEDS
jgi:tetratricopeptide (TPR) repeat protein